MSQPAATRSLSAAVLMLFLAIAPSPSAQPNRDSVLATMKKSTMFMMNTVSNRGGFLAKYTEDLSEQWGEVPARRSMVWVQKPGTVGVGQTLLEAYRTTQDEVFLDAAKECAQALIWGQLPSGGWNYFIDFDPEGTAAWYEEIGAKAWGWEEFYHFHGNATFDDDVTAGAAVFLLDLYTLTLDPAYREPVMKVVEGMLASQYPVGGWPQRFPVRESPDGAGHTEYTAYHTFNDGVIVGNIHFLWKAHQQLGLSACKEAALRGMYFVMISQTGTPQAGWGQQYDLNLKPAGARNYEPAGLCPSTTASNIRHLQDFYGRTGDRRFLRGIPDALDWLDAARLPEGHSTEGHTHAQFVEVGTGKPLYAHREGTSMETGRYWVDYEPGNFPGHYGMQLRLDVEALRKEHERVDALSPEEAAKEWAAKQQPARKPAAVTGDAVQGLLDSVNERGAWIEDLSMPDHRDWKGLPRHAFRGISTRTYCNNMKILMQYVDTLQD
jgi:PelA/Pel-15E family pectate lyase